MAEVKMQGKALVDDIAAAECPPGKVCFWWLGQNGFIVKGGSTVLYLDPYLSTYCESESGIQRNTPPPLQPEEVTNADLILCTHDHADHIDPWGVPKYAQASPQAMFVAPRTARQRMIDLGVPEERLVPLSDGETAMVKGVQITAVKSKHEFFDEVTGVGFPWLGYVVTLNGVTFYHAGDGIPYEGLMSTLKRFPIDIIFVPINGRDGRRYRQNILGNFTFQEAVDLCGELKPKLCVPMHYDLFPGNTEDPNKFTDYLSAKYPELKAWVGAAGERVELAKLM